jgi:ATP-dependent Zn protease
MTLLILIVVVLAITALPSVLDDDPDRRGLPYSELKALVRESPEEIDSLVFRQDDLRIEVRMANGDEAETTYPSDASAATFEELLDEQGVAYSAEPSSEYSWWSFALYLLPFVLFIVCMFFLLRYVDAKSDKGNNGELV